MNTWNLAEYVEGFISPSIDTILLLFCPSLTRAEPNPCLVATYQFKCFTL